MNTKPLTANMQHTLCDLYAEASGNLGTYYPATGVHWNTLKGLERRGLAKIDVRNEGKLQWYAALTERGIDFACQSLVINDEDIKQERPRKCKPIFFELDKGHHVEALEVVEELKVNRKYQPTMINLLRLHRDMGAGGMVLLSELYPDVVQAMRQQVRLELQHEMHLRDDSKMSAVIDELANMRDLLKSAPQAAPRDLQTVQGAEHGIGTINGAGVINAPNFDDDTDIVLTVSKDTSSSDASHNFINSMLALQS